MQIPKTQSQLIRAARGIQTQTEFARLLGVDRTCLSRYERELLGAPTSVINYCLGEVAKRICSPKSRQAVIVEVLDQARALVTALEQIGWHADISDDAMAAGDQQ